VGKLTYKEAGVDIKEAAALVGDIGELRMKTEGKRSLFQPFGLFAASYDLSGYSEPVMVTGCDGVGTKLELLFKYDLLETAGKDLVAMNVNDILTTGGDPLVFLDYIGVGRLDKPAITRLIAGMAEHLAACDCVLGGGETAEMPGMVKEGVIELSGFCVGAAEKKDLIDPAGVAPGDVLVGYPSDGFHANGFSLVRRVLAELGDGISDEEVVSLLAPTRLYYDEVVALRKAGVKPRAMAHITGGGLPEYLERLLGVHGAALQVPDWELGVVPKILGAIDEQEGVNTFNMGFGWVVVVAAADEEAALACGTGARRLGEVGGGEITVKVG
jgi:phosphoribosylformylglycinamidine cyclo-ligase